MVHLSDLIVLGIACSMVMIGVLMVVAEGIVRNKLTCLAGAGGFMAMFGLIVVLSLCQ